jgi:hypothetical protein
MIIVGTPKDEDKWGSVSEGCYNPDLTPICSHRYHEGVSATQLATNSS